MFRVLLAVVLIFSGGVSVAADGLIPGQKFKVPFSVDGKASSNRALVSVDAKGNATLTVTFVKAGEIEDVYYTLTRQDSPAPTPDPTPEPIPADKLWGVVVYESSEQTPQQAIVMLSAKVRKLFDGEQFRVIDKDTKAADPWKSYVDAAKSKTLPYLFLVDPEGKVAFEGSLPATVDATVALIAKYRKGGAK